MLNSDKNGDFPIFLLRGDFSITTNIILVVQFCVLTPLLRNTQIS